MPYDRRRADRASSSIADSDALPTAGKLTRVTPALALQQDQQPPSRDDAGLERETALSEDDLDIALGEQADRAKLAIGSQFDRRVSAVQSLATVWDQKDFSAGDAALELAVVAALSFTGAAVEGYVLAKLASTARNRYLATSVKDVYAEAGKKGYTEARNAFGASSSAYFEGQIKGLHQASYAQQSRMIAAHASARRTASGQAAAARRQTMQQQIAAFQRIADSVEAVLDATFEHQYATSAAQMLAAKARTKHGAFERDGQALAALGTRTDGIAPLTTAKVANDLKGSGTVVLSFGLMGEWPPRPTLFTVSGMNSTVFDKIKGYSIEFLGLPMIATGFIYDKTSKLDTASVVAGATWNTDNIARIGRNEDGGVYSRFGSDATAAAMKITGADDQSGAAMKIADYLSKLALSNAQLI